MADDLLDDLTTYCLCGHVDYGWYYSVGGKGCPLCRAKVEIKRLRAEMQQVRLDHITTLGELQEAAAEIEWLKEALTDAQNEARRG